MLNLDQSRIVVDLVRKKAGMLRGDHLKPLRLINSLIAAGEAQLPEQYLLPFTSGLRRIVESSRFDLAALPSAVGSLFNKNQLCGSQNLADLEGFRTRIHVEFGSATDKVVLLGDGAALAGLYQDPGAYRAAHWEAVLPDGTCANGDNPKSMRPPQEEWSEEIRFGQALWMKPKPALLIALFAGYVGDPTRSPSPPMWPHLGLAMLLWRDRVSVDQVLDVGSRLGQRDEIERGLAILAHIFPELSNWSALGTLNIPKWERKFAIPIAARRLMIGERD
jgi:hypothetical protein